MAATSATNHAGHTADITPNTIIYRPITWKDVDAVVDLFDRTWPQDGALGGTRFSLLISKYFVLHYLQPTTFANAAFTQDGTLAGVTFIRVAGERPQLDEIDVADEMDATERLIRTNSEASKRLDMVKNAFALELDLERGSKANETTLGELELFVVNPDVRGHGVGGGLWKRMQQYLAAWDVDAFYLHTDSDCDVSFYDHKGLERIAERPAGTPIEDGKEPLFDDMFIYRGRVDA
ncbi:GNAT family N-acetyltransferase [Bifidobacterium sp.]|uniref:GNAT family N-acetyltransferase n=1 Tax=Bifidobacterium sp. TaxID=41200 RepID=UPI003D7D13E8